MSEPKRWKVIAGNEVQVMAGYPLVEVVAAEDYDRLREERDEIAKSVDELSRSYQELGEVWDRVEGERDEARALATQLAGAVRVAADPGCDCHVCQAIAAALAVFDAKENA